MKKVITSAFLISALAGLTANANDLLDAKKQAICNDYGDASVAIWKSKFKRPTDSFAGLDEGIPRFYGR